MNSHLRELRDLLDDNNVRFIYSDLIDEIDDDFIELEDELSNKDCNDCEKFVGYIDPVDLHRDFQQLEAQYQLKQISLEAYQTAKLILEKYVTI